jgi:hypothetical protein
LSKASIPRKTGNLHLQHPPPFARLIDKASNFLPRKPLSTNSQFSILNPHFKKSLQVCKFFVPLQSKYLVPDPFGTGK